MTYFDAAADELSVLSCAPPPEECKVHFPDSISITMLNSKSSASDALTDEAAADDRLASELMERTSCVLSENFTCMGGLLVDGGAVPEGVFVFSSVA